MSLHVSVVLVTHNRIDHLRKCILALDAQSLSASQFEVIVIDNGSTDETPQYLSSLVDRDAPTYRFFRQENLGPAAARNLGVREAEADLIAFTDDDCLPASDWLERLLGALPEDLRCAGVGGKIVRVKDSLIGRYIDHIGSMQPSRRHDTGEVMYLVTANALYRRSCLTKIGGFDSRITWPGGEDPDLSHRLRQEGFFFAATEGAVVRHHHRDTIRGLYTTFWNYGRGRSAKLHANGVSDEGRAGFDLILRLARRSLRYLFRKRQLSLRERAAFSVLCWVREIGFQRGGASYWKTTDRHRDAVFKSDL